jgi:hypothetical protein
MVTFGGLHQGVMMWGKRAFQVSVVNLVMSSKLHYVVGKGAILGVLVAEPG